MDNPNLNPATTSEPPLTGLDSDTRRRIRNARQLMEQLGNMDKYSLGDFLCVLFNYSDCFNKSVQGSLTQWLCGHTRNGTRPAEIVDAIYRHPHSLKHHDYEPKIAALKLLSLPERPSSARSDLAVNFLPPGLSLSGNRTSPHVKELYNSREGLEEWAARAMLFRANKEADLLEKHLSSTVELSWDAIREFSIKREQEKMKEYAPMLWALLSQIALNKRRLARRNQGYADIDEVSSSDSESSSDSDDFEDVELPEDVPIADGKVLILKRAKKRTDKAASWAMFSLLGHRNRRIGGFKNYLGIYWFASNAHKDVFRSLSCLGLSPAYNTVRERLKTLAKWAKTRLREVGQRAYESSLDEAEEPEFFMFNFDNINKYVLPREETVGNKAQMRNGTAATVIILEDIPAGAFQREPYIHNLEAGLRRELTVDSLYQDIDYSHLSKAGTGAIMRILAKNVSGLKRLRGGVEQLFQDPNFCAVNRLHLRKSRMHPLGTSGINEATVHGASDVIDDLVDQMGMCPEWFDNLLVLVGGDQLSVDRTRRGIGYLDQEEAIRKQKSWALPLIQPWHMGWAFLKNLMNTHWHEETGKGTMGLRRSIGVLGRELSTEHWDYYPTFNAVSIVFSTMVLSAARQVAFLYQIHPDAMPPSQTGKQLPLLEELDWFFSDSGPAKGWTLEELRGFARCLYDEYLTTEGYQRALSGGTTDLPPSASIEAVLIHNMKRKLQLSTEAQATASSSRTRRRKAPRVVDGEESILGGDQVGSNGKLFMRDAFYFLEFADAMKDGDPGRMFKVMDVFRFAFWGAGSNNYGSELLELACNFKFEYPEALKQAIVNNYLVNPSGLPKHWQAGDLLQEHLNNDIKNIFNSKNLDFDSQFMRESISLNIAGFSDIKESVPELLGLARTGRKHTKAKYKSDINVLGAHFSTEKVFEFTPNRKQPYTPRDMIAEGHTKLTTGALETFLSRTLGDRTAVREGDAGDNNGNTQEELAPEYPDSQT